MNDANQRGETYAIRGKGNKFTRKKNKICQTTQFEPPFLFAQDYFIKVDFPLIECPSPLYTIVVCLNSSTVNCQKNAMIPLCISHSPILVLMPQNVKRV